MLDKDSKVSALCEASNLMRAIAGESVGKRALLKLSRKLPAWSFRHVKAVWYRENNTIISADQMSELRRAAREKEAGDDLECLRARVERLEQLLARYTDENRHPADTGRPSTD